MLRDGMIFLFPRIAEVLMSFTQLTLAECALGPRRGRLCGRLSSDALCARCREASVTSVPPLPDAGVDLQTGAQAAGLGAVVSHRDDNTDPASPWRCSGPRKSDDLGWLRETHVSSLWLRAMAAYLSVFLAV